MKNLLKYTAIMLLPLIIGKSLNAQYYDNIYRAADADLLQVNGKTRIEHILKGAAIILPDGSNQLKVSINIPYNAIDNKPADGFGLLPPGLLFNLTINIDPALIAEDLTSAKTFSTDGFLTLNNLTKAVTVKYIPMASRTEENGNFDVYLSLQFKPADFNLNTGDNATQCTITIMKATVNRA